MADYLLSIRPILTIEGYSENKRTGYVNDPDDSGGETLAGISRNNYPKEPLWKLVDIAKKDKAHFPKNLGQITGLDESVLNFYLINFWNKVGGNGIKTQAIGGILCNAAVNKGISPAVKIAEGIVGIPLTGEFSELLTQKLNAL